MKKSAFKKQLFELYDLDVEGLSFSEKIDFIENSLSNTKKSIQKTLIRAICDNLGQTKN